MKQIFLAFLLLAIVSVNVQAQTKRALIIAIGHYPDEGKNLWPEINSLNDVPLITTALLKQNFLPKNIWTLEDVQATKTGIEKALDKLIDSARTGDIVVIHISSHGHQIEDDNTNEEQDGLDECIVPYGAVYTADRSVFNKYSSGYLRDDVFGEKITRLRNKLGSKGDVLVDMDACHSGTGTRGPATHKARGNNSPMVSADFEKKRKTGVKDAAGVFKENTTTALNKDAATYVLFSGAQAQERNYECNDDEGNNVGSLTYAFSKVLTTLEGNVTYRTLFAKIEDIMRQVADQQKPVLEGDGIDRELFGGKYQRQTPYLLLDLAHSNPDTMFVNSGSVAGVTMGSIVGFYPAGTTNPTGLEPIQKGTVVISSNFTAAIKLDKPNEEFLKKAPWAFVLEMSYGGNPIRLNVDSLDAKSLQNVRDALKDEKGVTLTSDGELYLGKNDEGTGWSLRYVNSGIVFDDVNINNAMALKNTLKRYDRFRYLKDLNIQEEGLSAKVELVFLDAKKKINKAKLLSRTKFGRLELIEGDTVFLKIKNTGTKDMFINIVDIQPDGIINRVMPNRELKDVRGLPRPILPENCKIARKDSVVNTDMMIVISKPYGQEIFKVFLSRDQLDLEDILAGKSDVNSKTRGILNNMAKVFESAENKNGARGGNPTVGTGQDGTIFSLNFAILEKKE